MPLPLLGTLPASARAAYPFVVAGVRRGLSSRAIERVIRSAGFTISRPRSIIPMMQAIRIIESQGSAVRFIPKTSTIDANRLPESLTPIRREFSYQVRVRGRDVFGQLLERNVTVTTDRRFMTPEEIEDTARGFIEDQERYGVLTTVEVQLTHGLQRSAAP